jgi:hypothetical protein
MLTRTRLRALLATSDTAGHRQSDARIRYDSPPLHGETSCTSKDLSGSAGIDPCVPTVAQHAVCRARPCRRYLNLKFAVCIVPSFSMSWNCRHYSGSEGSASARRTLFSPTWAIRKSPW